MSRRFRPGLSLAVATLLLAGVPRAGRAANPDEVTRLPAPLEDVALARDGRLLVLKLRGEKALRVYDAEAGKLTGTLDIGTDRFTFGAGGDTVVVAPEDRNEIQSWSLATLAQIRAKEFADRILITHIIMGRARDDLALLRMAAGTNALDQTNLRVLDVRNLSLVRSDGPGPQGIGHNRSYRDFVHFRADAGMDRITEWATSHSPTGLGLFTRTDAGTAYLHRYDHNSAGYLVPGDDGLLYTGHGGILRIRPPGSPGPDPSSQSFEVVATLEARSPIPGLGGQFFLAVDRAGKLDIHQSGQATPLCPIEPFLGWALPAPPLNVSQMLPAGPFPPGRAEEYAQTRMTLDRRLVFAPAAGTILFLPPSNDRIIRREFDLKAALDDTGTDYLLFLSSPPPRGKAGARWEYTLRSLARHGPVRYKLEHAPGGLTLDDQGRLAWTIPTGIEGRAPVTIVATDAQGQVVRQAFHITFD